MDTDQEPGHKNKYSLSVYVHRTIRCTPKIKRARQKTVGSEAREKNRGYMVSYVV